MLESLVLQEPGLMKFVDYHGRQRAVLLDRLWFTKADNSRGT